MITCRNAVIQKVVLNAESTSTESAAIANTPRKVYTMIPESCKFSQLITILQSFKETLQ